VNDPAPTASSWRDRSIAALVVLAFSSGFGQFGAIAALGDVARTFGQVAHGTTIADQAGLSGTELGIGLAILRLASLGGMPLAGLADRFGRRRMLLVTVSVGLVLTVLAAASPSYWAFVVIFGAGRPFLSATNGLAAVAAVEESPVVGRTSAVAVVAAGYGVGAGATAVLHSLGLGGGDFRVFLPFALVPLVLVAAVRRSVHEPARYTAASRDRARRAVSFGSVGRPLRRRFGLVLVLTFALSFVTGPANTFVFLYAQDFVHQSGGVTAAMVVGSGVAGLGGLFAGRWLADRVGRRPVVVAGTIAVAGFATITYSGSRPALIAGYVLGVAGGSILAPAIGSIVNELFPTSVRATVTGWTVAAGVLGAVAGLSTFGALADVGARFSSAAFVTFIPAAFVAVFWFALPETRGVELE
jgi:MFS family permease